MNRLSTVVNAVEQSWQTPEIDRQLETFSGFCDLVGVTRAQNYILEHRGHELEDWSKCNLDDVGKAIQDEMTERFLVCCYRA